MTHRGLVPVLALLCLVALTGCSNPSPPSETPTASATPTAAASPSSEPVTASPTASPSSSPTPTPAPPADDPPPHRVDGVTASEGGGSGEVLLRWSQNPEDDIDYYIVLRSSTPGGELTRIGTVTPQEVTQFDVVPFVDIDVTVGYYRVRAVDAAGQQGPKSREVCGASIGHTC